MGYATVERTPNANWQYCLTAFEDDVRHLSKHDYNGSKIML